MSLALAVGGLVVGAVAPILILSSGRSLGTAAPGLWLYVIGLGLLVLSASAAYYLFIADDADAPSALGVSAQASTAEPKKAGPAIPVLATANTPAQRRLGKHWKRIQRVTYALWALIVIHLLLLDGFKTFAPPEGDVDPVFHQRFYQSVAISLPLILLRLPPVKRWVTAKRADGQKWKVWLLVAVIGVPYLVGMIFIINEEIFTGMMCLTMHPPAN